ICSHRSASSGSTRPVSLFRRASPANRLAARSFPLASSTATRFGSSVCGGAPRFTVATTGSGGGGVAVGGSVAVGGGSVVGPVGAATVGGLAWQPVRISAASSTKNSRLRAARLRFMAVGLRGEWKKHLILGKRCLEANLKQVRQKRVVFCDVEIGERRPRRLPQQVDGGCKPHARRGGGEVYDVMAQAVAAVQAHPDHLAQPGAGGKPSQPGEGGAVSLQFALPGASSGGQHREVRQQAGGRLRADADLRRDLVG